MIDVPPYLILQIHAARSSLRVDILTATVQGTINAVKSTSSLSVKY